MKGVVYKLCSDNTTNCYIGSTTSKYPSIRLAHHRQAHRRGTKDYKGLFDNGDPRMEILEEVKYECDKSPLRVCELKHLQDNLDNAINIRLPYSSFDDQKRLRDLRIKRYHQSEKGKLAVEKASLNAKIKNEINPFKLMTMNDRISFLEDKQDALRKEHGTRTKETICNSLVKIESTHSIIFN
tara:strand:- start:14278 stop:14826 length:549 start_codon:yes stop_codon:yes gene_type:complete